MTQPDDLEGFLHWWLASRPIQQVPEFGRVIHDDQITGVVLYRQAPYQVQLFIVAPNAEIDDHIHPNVDSYEVYLTGDVDFRVNGKSTQAPFVRVAPDAWHGGSFGPQGGSFMSVQKWLNGVPPSSVGADWKDHNGNDHGRAYRQEGA